MTTGGHGVAPPSPKRVAGRPAYSGRLTVTPSPDPPSRRQRVAGSFGKAFYWEGWKTVAAVAASLVAISTAVVAIQTFRVSSQTLQANTLLQTSDRFGKAIDQLGSDKIDIRLGGIYGLERLARDSPSIHVAAYDILSAFVREHAPAGTGDCANHGPIDRYNVPYPSEDVQTAIFAVDRRDRKNDTSGLVIDFSDSCLLGTDFSNAQAAYIEMVGSDLRYADFQNADLADAALADADVAGANLENADLRRADLRGAILAGANLVVSHLAGASLLNADLDGADLRGADLTGADLGADPHVPNPRGANLTGANLSGATLTGIHYDPSTQWPNGFTPPPSQPTKSP